MQPDRTLDSPSGANGEHDWAPPSRIGKYELRKELGRGSSGVVFLGFDPFVQREVAIKIARGNPEANDAEPDRHTFFAEARSAGMLQHPHIVSLFDAGVEGDLNYIVMEYVSGETLREYCRKNGKRLPTAQVVDSMYKCGKALDYSHNKGVLHRDIKPSNIMLDRDGEAKIMDFSVAQLTHNRSTGADLIVGSPLYMAPEQIRGGSPCPQSDLYALGAVMYELLAGEPPFTGRDIHELFDAIQYSPTPQLSKKKPDLPPALADIVERLLHKEARLRFQTGLELATALNRVYDELRYTSQQLTRRENQDSLRSLSFFNDFPDSEIDELLQVSSMLSFKKGDIIIQEGDIDNSFYILALGTVEVRKGSGVLQTLGKGDCFGEIGFLMKTKRTATIVASSPVAALKINATQIQQVSKECQLHYYKVFAESLIYRLSFTSAQLATLSDRKQ